MVQINNMEQTPRRPRTSALIGQAIGGAFEAAGSKYLQGKMGEMFQNRQDERNFAIQKRSAEGIAELYPEEYRPFVIQAGSVLPIDQHAKLAETGLDFLQGRFNAEKNGLKKPKGGGTPPPSPSQPLNTSQQQNYQPPYQPRNNQALNPTDEAKSLAASQRQGTGAVPMPGYPQTYNAQQPFIPNQQQYQPVGGMPNAMQAPTQIPQRIMAGGQISPEPISNQIQQEGQETGPRERLIPPVEQQVQQEQEGPKRLADMTEEEFQDYISDMRASEQTAKRKERREDIKDKRSERFTNAAVKKADVYEKESEEKSEVRRREINKPVDDFLNDIASKHRSQKQRDVNLEAIEDLSKKSGDSTRWKLGFAKFANIDPELLLNRDEATIQKLSYDLLPSRVREFQGQGSKVFVAEVNAMINTIPSLMQSPEGRVTISRFLKKMNELHDIEYASANEMRKEYKKDKFYPSIGDAQFELNERIESEGSKILQEASEIGKYGQVYRLKPGEATQHLPKPDSVPAGLRLVYQAEPGQKPLYPDGTTIESDGKKWIKIEE